MIELLNEERRIYMITGPAKPDPTERAYKRMSHLVFLANKGQLDATYDRMMDVWIVGKRKPLIRDVPELVWLRKQAPKLKVTYEGLVGEQSCHLVEFNNPQLELLFKLAFGGEQCEPLAFAA